MPCLTQRESQAPLVMEDFLTENGILLILQSDNSKVMTIRIMKKIMRKERMQQALAEPKYQYQNRLERMVQIVKDLMCRLMYQHHYLPQFWCFALEITHGVMNHTSREGRRNERSPIEIEEGHPSDLNRFQFSLLQEIKFEKDEQSFPNESWTKGRPLGHATKNGELLTFQVVEPTKKHNPLVRSAVQGMPVEILGS